MARTSKRVAKKASGILRKRSAGKDCKSVAGAALRERRNRKKGIRRSPRR